MILTLTPNPSLDLLFLADELCWDDANRVAMPRARPGGQGVNVARAARALGAVAHAVFPAGGTFGELLIARLTAEETPFDAVPISGDTRLFVGVRELATGRSMLINPRGPEFSATEHNAGVRFIPDCDGAALRAAVSFADALVPNLHEAERLLGERIDGIDSAARAVRRVAGMARDFAVIKLGAAGAVICAGDAVWHAAPPPVDRGSAVGAGDALLAALLTALGQGQTSGDALRFAVAAGTAVLYSEDDTLVRRADVDTLLPQVQVRRV